MKNELKNIYENALQSAFITILDVEKDKIREWGKYIKNFPLNHISFGNIDDICTEKEFHYFCENLWFDRKYYEKEENHWQVRIGFKFFLNGLRYKERTEE